MVDGRAYNVWLKETIYKPWPRTPFSILLTGTTKYHASCMEEINSKDVVGLLALPTTKANVLTKLNASIVVKLTHLLLDLVKYGKRERSDN